MWIFQNDVACVQLASLSQFNLIRRSLARILADAKRGRFVYYVDDWRIDPYDFRVLQWVLSTLVEIRSCEGCRYSFGVFVLETGFVEVVFSLEVALRLRDIARYLLAARVYRGQDFKGTFFNLNPVFYWKDLALLRVLARKMTFIQRR